MESEEKRGKSSEEKLLEISGTITTTTPIPESEAISTGVGLEEVERKEEEEVDMDEEGAILEVETVDEEEEATESMMIAAAEQGVTGEKVEEEVTMAEQEVIGEQQEETATEAEGTTLGDEKMTEQSTKPKEEYPLADLTENGETKGSSGPV